MDGVYYLRGMSYAVKMSPFYRPSPPLGPENSLETWQRGFTTQGRK